jgi:general secretion pathway protein A
MYHYFYGLCESPFALTPDPKYLFLSPSHKDALAAMIYGVHERKGFILILGEVGTGKTTLVRHILGQSGMNMKIAFIFTPVASFEELLQMVLQDLEVPCQSQQRLAMINALSDFLLQELVAERYVVLIIDEAQYLCPAILEDLRMFSNVETAHNKLLQIILVGQPELGEKLGHPDLRQLRQRIGLVAKLHPLTVQETRHYIAHRLKGAGYAGGELFTSRAQATIYRASQGIPRLINVICDKALVLGYGADAKQITDRIVKEVVKDWSVFGPGIAPAPTRPRLRRAPMLLVLMAVVLILVFMSEPSRALLPRLWRMLVEKASDIAAGRGLLHF